MKKSKIITLLIGVLSASMLCGAVACAGSVGTVSIYLAKEQKASYIDSVGRSGLYSYVSTHLNSVSPSGGGVDNYTKVQAAVFTTGHSKISDDYTLFETSSNNTYMTIWEGSLNNTTVSLGYWGNNPKLDANAIIYYNGF